MSFGIVGMLTARNSFRTKMFFQGMGLTQDKVALAVTDFRKSKVETDNTLLFRVKQTLKDMEENIARREENEKRQASKQANIKANEEARIAKQTKREQALKARPKKIVMSTQLTKMTEQELKKELGRLAQEKRKQETDNERRTRMAALNAQLEEQRKIQADIDRQKTQAYKERQSQTFRMLKAKQAQDNGLVERLIKASIQFEAYQEGLRAKRQAAEARKMNLINAIKELQAQINS